MTDAQVEEFAVKIDSIWEAITRLETRVAEISAREPGKIRTDHPHIVRVQGVCGGRPVIEGTRLSVKLIVGWARMGMTAEEIAAQYPVVSIVQIADALAYYEEWGLLDLILFGSDFPAAATPKDTMERLRKVNEVVAGTNLPKIPSEEIEGIIHRDSLRLLRLK